MKGKFMIIAALMGALTFGACVDSQESASVEAVRNAKAKQLESVATLNNAKAQAEATIAAAEAQLAAAQAQLLAAQAAALNAETEAQKIANQLAAAEAQAQIAWIEAELEIALIELQEEILAAQIAFNKAKEGMVAEERTHLENIYAGYNAAMNEIAGIQLSIADFNKKIAEAEAAIAKLDADKNWESVVSAANKAVTDAQKKVTDTESKIASKKSAYAALEAMGGVNYAEVCAAYDAAVEAEAAALKDYKYAVKNTETKSQERLANNRAIRATTYALNIYELFDMSRFVYPVIDANGDIVGEYISTFALNTIDTNNDGKKDAYGFYPATMNSNGVYASDVDATPIALFSYSTTAYTEDEYGDDCDPYFTSYLAPNVDGVAAMAEERAKILSTSDYAKNLEVAKLNLAAWEKASAYEDVVELYEEYLEDVADVKAEIAEAEAKIAANNYLISVYEATDYAGSKEEYADEIEELEEENDELDVLINGTSKKTGLVDELDELEEDLEEALQKATDDKTYDKADAEAAIADYKQLVAIAEAAQETYDEAVAWNAMVTYIWGVVIGEYAEVEALVANDAAIAEAYHAAHVAEDAAYEAYSDAQELTAKLNDVKTDLANSAADSAEYLMSVEMEALAAEIKTLEATLKTAKSDLEKAQKKAADYAAMTEEEIAKVKDKYLADEIKALEEKIEGYEDEIALLEQQLNVAEGELANWSALLNEALN